jgi:hypothetical protein
VVRIDRCDTMGWINPSGLNNRRTKDYDQQGENPGGASHRDLER